VIEVVLRNTIKKVGCGCGFESFVVGTVTGTSGIGGLVGSGSLTVQASFWDTVSSGISTSHGGTGLSTAEMQNPVTYENAGWDMIEIWKMEGTADYPKLRGE
jgi:hypothetical protein